MQGNLYVVSTPIGNLEDITFRAISTLKGVDVIFAESIERTKKLLSHYDIDKKVFSYNKDNERLLAAFFTKMYDDSKNLVPQRKKLYDELCQKFSSKIKF